MPCNCTAPLRADIIKRFFANDSRKNEFALELIRIVECQQDTMSYDLREWFRIYFGFNDILLGQFLNCVLKQQTTMSKELEGVIRARYFPASQDMANDFIRVVLCSCCPTICGTDIEIIGISNDYTVDGWYLEFGASNLVYMESNVITDTVACSSGFAQLVFELVASNYDLIGVFSSATWNYMGNASVSESGLDHTFNINLNYTDSLNNQLQVTYDGITWEAVYSTDGSSINYVYTASSHNFRWRVLNYFEECPYYLGTTEGVCPIVKADDWAYSIPSSVDNGGSWEIYPLATIPSGFTVNVELSTDGGTTWGDLRVNYDPTLLDGITPLGTGVTYGLSFKTRLKVISSLNCDNYSVEITTA